MESLYKFENDLLEKKVPKNNRVYDVNSFERKEDFLADIGKDKELFKAIKQELEQLNIVEQDPKREAVYAQIDHILKNESPKRKVVVFSEYIDTRQKSYMRTAGRNENWREFIKNHSTKELFFMSLRF